MTETQIRSAIDAAFLAAKASFNADMAKHGDDWGPCGFAWVVVKPGNSKLAKILTKDYGAGKHYRGGVCLWAPGTYQSGTQNMDIKENAAFAFAKTLRDMLNLPYEKCFADSRMD